MKKYCVICKEIINKEDSYFKIELFIKGDLRGIDYAHKTCWINQRKSESSTKELVSGALKLLRSRGITEPSEEVIIV